MTDEVQKAAASLREYALSLPEAYEDFPWGELVIKVNKKIFVFISGEAELEKGFRLGVKLPVSSIQALNLPFTQPSGYGLGKASWVTAHFSLHEPLPTELLISWIEESYRAIAPKKLVRQLESSN